MLFAAWNHFIHAVKRMIPFPPRAVSGRAEAALWSRENGLSGQVHVSRTWTTRFIRQPVSLRSENLNIAYGAPVGGIRRTMGHNPWKEKVSARSRRWGAQARRSYPEGVRPCLIQREDDAGEDDEYGFRREEVECVERREHIMADQTVGIALVQLSPFGAAQTVDCCLAILTYM